MNAAMNLAVINLDFWGRAAIIITEQSSEAFSSAEVSF
jgi:hypothetical protein